MREGEKRCSELVHRASCYPGGVAGGFRMLISFQGFGHGDSTDFKDWTDSFNRIGFRSRQLSGWFFQILDFKLRVFSKDWVSLVSF